jgi:hypothetical protein
MTSLLEAIENKYMQTGDEIGPQDGSFIILAPKAGARATVPSILVSLYNTSNNQILYIKMKSRLLRKLSALLWSQLILLYSFILAECCGPSTVV